jgi:hypothetical protein
MENDRKEERIQLKLKNDEEAMNRKRNLLLQRLQRPGSRGRSSGSDGSNFTLPVILGSKHADFVEMKVHGLEARINNLEMKPGTQIKEFLMINSGKSDLRTVSGFCIRYYRPCSRRLSTGL